MQPFTIMTPFRAYLLDFVLLSLELCTALWFPCLRKQTACPDILAHVWLSHSLSEFITSCRSSAALFIRLNYRDEMYDLCLVCLREPIPGPYTLAQAFHVPPRGCAPVLFCIRHEAEHSGEGSLKIMPIIRVLNICHGSDMVLDNCPKGIT